MTEIVYVCTEDRSQQLFFSINSVLQSETEFDLITVFTVGFRPQWDLKDKRIKTLPVAPLYGSYFYGNKTYVSMARGQRIIFLDTDTVVKKPLHPIWLNERASFMARPGSSYENPDWNREVWNRSFEKRPYPMFNAGFMIFQNNAHSLIGKTWEQMVWKYLRGEIPAPWPDPRMLEQFALSHALSEHDVAFKSLTPREHCFGWEESLQKETLLFHTGHEKWARLAGIER